MVLVSAGGRGVVFVANREIDLDAGLCPLRLLAKVVAEVIGELPGVAMNVDDQLNGSSEVEGD